MTETTPFKTCRGREGRAVSYFSRQGIEGHCPLEAVDAHSLAGDFRYQREEGGAVWPAGVGSGQWRELAPAISVRASRLRICQHYEEARCGGTQHRTGPLQLCKLPIIGQLGSFALRSAEP